MEYAWRYRPLPSKEDIDRLKTEINASEVTATLLLQRGVHTFEEAKAFFNPSIENQHDPMLLKGMAEAVKRIAHAIENNEKILIYGDYDVDGTTATAMVFGELRKATKHIDFYLPDRYKEGYGVSTAGIDFAHASGCKLMITLDCGIRSVDKVSYANALGVEVIICDHHNPGPELPAAVAVIDAKQADCPYPYKELSGAGVGYKLLCALENNSILSDVDHKTCLQLLAVSIASDLVPITGENRIFTYQGLQYLNEAPTVGIAALMKTANLKSPIRIREVVFGIGPRINAAGRLAHAGEVVNLLLEKQSQLADARAGELNVQNTERRDLDRSITEEALAIMVEDGWYKTSKTNVIYSPDWHKGVIGIVASRCQEHSYKPTIVLCSHEGKVTGSARSIAGFDIHEAIGQCADLLIQYGGHTHAAGLTMAPDKVMAFREAFEQIGQATLTDEMLTPYIEVDAVIGFEQLSDKLLDVLERMGPYGPGHMDPIFVTRNLKDKGYSKVVKEEHAKLTLISREGVTMEGIAFGQAHWVELLKKGLEVDIAYHASWDTWNGNKKINIVIKDIKPSETN